MLKLSSIAKSLLRYPLATIAATLANANRANNLRRWADASSLKSEWDERTVQIARLIPPGSQVLEFGAGRLVLRDHLAQGCEYYPSDIVDRGEGTLVCNLNEALPCLSRRYTHAVFSGVLEYIEDVPRVVRFLAGHVDAVIASYYTTDICSDYLSRARNNWVNNYSDAEFVSVFQQAGFRLRQREGCTQGTVYCFERC